jgi:hypothetical protein
MTRAGDRFENTVTRERALVRVGGEDTGGRYLAVDTSVGPHALANERALIAVLTPSRACAASARPTPTTARSCAATRKRQWA